jgi:hypothetical protein
VILDHRVRFLALLPFACVGFQFVYNFYGRETPSTTTST